MPLINNKPRTNPEDERYAKLSGKFKHYCPDWDFMAIDETYPEFDACLCYSEEEKEKE